MRNIKRCGGVALAAVALAGWGSGARAGIIVGTLSTSSGASIPAPDVQAWITEWVPATTPKLVVLTECYGGNALPDFTGNSTAVISATSAFQQATYGYFDMGSASALGPDVPAAMKTAQNVLDGGSERQAPTETPIFGGGLALGSYSLDNATAAGDVQGRQVLVYAGQPDGGKLATDAGLLNTIAGNFTTVPAQAATSVEGVGDKAVAPWTLPGTPAGLQGAISASGGTLAAAADPTKVQFALYATDHGGLRNVAVDLNRSSSAPTLNNTIRVVDTVPPAPPPPPAGLPLPALPGTGLTQNFQTFTSDKVTVLNPNTPISGSQGTSPDLVDNIPCFSILVPFDAFNTAPQLVGGALAPGLTAATDLIHQGGVFGGAAAWTLYLQNVATGVTVSEPCTFELLYNPTTDVTMDAGIRVCFQVQLAGVFPDSDTPGFQGIFLNDTYNVSVVNNWGRDFDVTEFSQENPSISNIVPEPIAAAPLALPMALLGRRRWRESMVSSC
jgi:hypothetical protein